MSINLDNPSQSEQQVRHRAGADGDEGAHRPRYRPVTGYGTVGSCATVGDPGQLMQLCELARRQSHLPGGYHVAGESHRAWLLSATDAQVRAHCAETAARLPQRRYAVHWVCGTGGGDGWPGQTGSGRRPDKRGGVGGQQWTALPAVRARWIRSVMPTGTRTDATRPVGRGHLPVSQRTMISTAFIINLCTSRLDVNSTGDGRSGLPPRVGCGHYLRAMARGHRCL